MASLFRPTRAYTLPLDAEINDKDGKPHIRMKDKGKTILYPLSKDGTKYLKPAAKWYGKYRDAAGVIQKPPLSSNKDAAQTMLTRILADVERERSGHKDPFKNHRKTSLTEHVNSWLEVQGPRSGRRVHGTEKSPRKRYPRRV